jgi:hypothetical protein
MMNDTQKPEPIDYFVGLDLGQQSDFTALIVLERRRRPSPRDHQRIVNHFALTWLRRWELGTRYPKIVEDVCQLVRTPPLDCPRLVVDQTGCGAAVVDLFRQAQMAGQLVAQLRPVVITAGHAIGSGDDGSDHIPKRELVSCVQVLLQSGRLKIAPLPEREILLKELQDFRVKITLKANEVFEADWREKAHDDLVLALALASWVGERTCGADDWEVIQIEPPDHPLHGHYLPRPRRRGLASASASAGRRFTNC